MKTPVWFAVVALAVAEIASAQCLGDFNGNNQVEINEIIVSINNALNGCEPSGDSCPIDFSDDNTQLGTPDCYYNGRWNQSCGDDQLETLWRSDAEIVLVTFTQLADVDCGGGVVSATEVELIGCFLGPDPENDFVEVSGTIRLGSNGSTLTLAPDSPPFTIEDCAVTRYEGRLTDVVTPSLRRGAAASDRERAQALRERLRNLRGAVRGKANFERR